MKTHIRNLFLVPVLVGGLGLMLAGPLRAQTFATLHSFTDSDGTGPNGLVLSGNVLYGTASAGGNSGNGSVFAVNTDGTGFTVLHSFTRTDRPSFSSGVYTNNDGAYPQGGLVLLGNALYGTAYQGGSSGNGTVFKANTDGTEFTVLHTFTLASTNSSGVWTNNDGAWPHSSLILLGNMLYGTTGYGGTQGYGTVFSVNTNGTGFSTLYSFNGGNDPAGPNGLISSLNIFYGTAGGGSSGDGTLFKLNTDGTGFTTLYRFSATFGPSYTNSDGFGPTGLILSGNTLYGTAGWGGSSGNGTVFSIRTDGTGFITLHTFTALSGDGYFQNPTNSDGAFPTGLILSGNTLYGTAANGGSSGQGTLFAVNTDGTGFTNLYSFTGGSNGGGPYGLIPSGNILYGTAGTVFSISLLPQLTIIPSGPNLILAWPTSYAGFDYTGYTLQSTTNLASPVWATNSPAPFVINGQNTVTNPISGTQQFFRLSQ